MREPLRIWWARPRKLCALERPGGGGRSHRRERREREIEWLKHKGVHTVISTMETRHNLSAYEEAGLRWLHVPAGDPEQALEDVLAALRRTRKRAGAVAIHGNRRTDFVAAACAAYLHETYGAPVEDALVQAAEAGLDVTPESAALIGARVSAIC